jgi:hypothetical protein
MKKEEFVKRRGIEAYKKKIEYDRQWTLDNPDKEQENSRKHTRKGGKYYLEHLKYKATGIQGERNRIRGLHADKWRRYKKIIAPGSQIHHEWISGTDHYRGVALVETHAHQHGIIDVIQILDGEITILTEAELKAK